MPNASPSAPATAAQNLERADASRLSAADVDAIATAVAEKLRAPTAISDGGSLCVSFKEAGRLIDCHERTIFNLVRDGELRAIPIGRHRKVLRSSIRDFLESKSRSS